MVPRKGKTAHAAALELLRRRALSERELAARLLRRGFSAREVEAELARLRKACLVSDRELARLLVRSRLAAGHGLWAVRAYLRQREVDPEAVEQALGEVEPEEEEAALARALEKALRRYPEGEALSRRQKVVRYLLSRGFGLAAALRATEFLGGELDGDALDEPGDPEDVS
ncbi:MAG: regulatory protein RecX [Thermoanaerobaculum sp.]